MLGHDEHCIIRVVAVDAHEGGADRSCNNRVLLLELFLGQLAFRAWSGRLVKWLACRRCFHRRVREVGVRIHAAHRRRGVPEDGVKVRQTLPPIRVLGWLKHRMINDTHVYHDHHVMLSLRLHFVMLLFSPRFCVPGHATTCRARREVMSSRPWPS